MGVKPSLLWSCWVNLLSHPLPEWLKNNWWGTSYVRHWGVCSKLESCRSNRMALQSSLGLGELIHTITDAVTQRGEMMSSLCMQAWVATVDYLWTQSGRWRLHLENLQTPPGAPAPLQRRMQHCKPATFQQLEAHCTKWCRRCYKPRSLMRIRRQISQSCLARQHRTALRCRCVTLTVPSGSGRAAENCETVGRGPGLDNTSPEWL